MNQLVPIGVIGVLLAGCAGLPPQSTRVNPVDQMRDATDQLVVITVRNPAEPIPVRAASGLRGYDAVPTYQESDQARAALADLASRYQLREIAAWPIHALHVDCEVFRIESTEARDVLLARLARDPSVGLAQPLQTFDTYSSGYNDPYFGLQRGFARIDAADAQLWSRGDGVRVAVIDTGLDATHPDLQGRIELQRNFVDANGSQFSADRHGTEVAGIIGADANNHEGIVGVAPEARILALKACWQLDARSDSAQCNSFTLAKALAIAIDSGARIINLSLGGPPDPLLTQLLGYALSRGIIVVGAVPPDGRLDGFPVGVAGVIAADTLEHPAAEGGALRAPGQEVLTLTPGGHYDFVSGSSLAAAHVSGAVALLLSADSKLSTASVYGLLKRTSAAGADGNQAINVCAALAAVRNSGQCAPLAASETGAASMR
jgi:hypothetical protein